ncbi:MAG TPA: hypothetical protein VGI40_04780 [Pirellulaceae bacterium]|jgi:hypothetical protein
MSQMPPTDPNPYQSPAAPTPVFQPSSGAHERLHKVLKDFRSQIIALGAFWIFIGVVVIAAGVVVSMSNEASRDPTTMDILVAVFGVMGAIWVALGVCVCLKQIWAVYVALTFSYLSLIGNLLRLQICGIVLLGAVIFQAHRVLRWAKELQAAGIPLTTRPEHLQFESAT